MSLQIMLVRQFDFIENRKLNRMIIGILVGITNALATIPGFVGPYVVGAITNNHVR